MTIELPAADTNIKPAKITRPNVVLLFNLYAANSKELMLVSEAEPHNKVTLKIDAADQGSFYDHPHRLNKSAENFIKDFLRKSSFINNDGAVFESSKTTVATVLHTPLDAGFEMHGKKWQLMNQFYVTMTVPNMLFN